MKFNTERRHCGTSIVTFDYRRFPFSKYIKYSKDVLVFGRADTSFSISMAVKAGKLTSITHCPNFSLYFNMLFKIRLY